MIADEARVWEKFMDLFPDRYTSVDYDFRVGEGVQIDIPYEENYARMVTMLSQHRIDVLAWLGEKPTIIEVKERAVISTIGQLIGYKALFVEEFKNMGEPRLLCVCERISLDVQFVFDKQNVPIEIV
jgi:hypothetical protein